MEFTMSGRLEVRITPDDVGKRVSVRSVADPGERAGTLTDTVGVLTSWTAEVVHITRRDGETVRIPEGRIVAAKVVPAAPARRRGLPAAGFTELARAAARGWPPVERTRLGDWELRASGGFTRRANSVLPLGDPGLPLDAALEHVVDWYARRGLPPFIQVSTGAEGADEQLAAALDERGWHRELSADVWIAGLAPAADAAGQAAGPAGVTLDRTPGPAWLRRYGRAGDPGPDAARVLAGGPSVWFATVPGEDDVPAAIGRCAVDGRWAGFTCVEVAPERRREGLATAVMAALAQRALDEGASAAYLQVESGNAAALALYDRLGFTRHHSYHHYRAPRG
ncbi:MULTISPECIES: GNAT family N-acetyltransferase [unclassified Streptomyces]|uniref:GNAT family N-acetyltransferase n=1 Tax=unclassified Streptomyces TaxID=2593676 RepID=UPI0022B60975|nr:MULTISPECIES: GNAT family N-acetyltransferase [unclassified Streptomyces]MCZ7416713.1 GNAT family N-acetyltransferase [Streptomyces sp. WMMC897]MCZ7433477.1 GNAT family N-acetyltransferase [Streptomyces sp. WMMC1477]